MLKPKLKLPLTGFCIQDDTYYLVSHGIAIKIQGGTPLRAIEALCDLHGPMLYNDPVSNFKKLEATLKGRTASTVYDFQLEAAHLHTHRSKEDRDLLTICYKSGRDYTYFNESLVNYARELGLRICRRNPDRVVIPYDGGGYILAFHGPGYDAYIAPMIVE